MTGKVSERISAAERRESILAAASVVFGERGYAGTTTDRIARAAGISQPYVVRMFGTKENLFVEVIERAVARLLDTFRGIIAESPGRGSVAYSEESEELAQKLGVAYVDLIEDRGILLSLMQGFIVGHDPVVGAKARGGFLAVYRLLRDEAGFDPDRIREFLAGGMLFNTLLALGLPSIFGEDEAAAELMRCTFRGKLDMVLGASRVAGADTSGK